MSRPPVRTEEDLLRSLVRRVTLLERRRSGSGGGGGGAGAVPAPGIVLPFSGNGPVPNGFLLADGSAVSRVTYAALFEVIGTTYGAGDGSTTFNLPNLLGRVVAGRDPANSDHNTVGKTGGNRSHRHDTTLGYDGANFFLVNSDGSVSINGEPTSSAVITLSRGGLSPGGAVTAAARLARTQSTPHLMPYITLQYIISTGAPVLPVTPNLLRGTTVMRDTAYGIPSTDAARVALANGRVQFWNEDEQWMECYFAPAGLPGLTVKGLLAGAPAGWYPLGPGPRAEARMTGTQAQTAGQQPTLWSFGVSGAYRTRADWFELFDSNKTLRVKRAGIYRFSGRMGYPNGSGTGVASWRGNVPTVLQWPVVLLGDYGQMSTHVIESMPLLVDQGVYFQTDAASWSIGGPQASMFLEYLGPPLVSV